MSHHSRFPEERVRPITDNPLQSLIEVAAFAILAVGIRVVLNQVEDWFQAKPEVPHEP